jgi:hypothetical protein
MAVNAAINENAARVLARRKLGILPPRKGIVRFGFFQAPHRDTMGIRQKEPNCFSQVLQNMRNGLYSIHIRMLDGVKGRASGVLVFRDGTILGGDPYFWSAGSYTVGKGTWKGEIVTNQHTPYHETDARPVFGGREVSTGFSGTFKDDSAEVFGTSLVGSRSVSFRATLRRLADN